MTIRTTRLRCYVAGAYSGPDVIAIRSNMRRGLQLAVKVLQAGFAPFAPWLDFEFGLLADIPLQDYYDYSMAWLEASDAVLVVPIGAETSKGTQAEIARAHQLGIPVFDSLRDLQDWVSSLSDYRSSALPTGDPPVELHGGLPVRSSHSGDQ